MLNDCSLPLIGVYWKQKNADEGEIWMAEKKERQKSFAGRLIRVWVLGIAVPLIAVELLFLVQFYRINSREAEKYQ